MFQVDFISATLGYVLGVLLCYNTMIMVYDMESKDNDN